MKTEWAFPAGLGNGAVLDLEISPRWGADTGSLAAQKVRDGLDQFSSVRKKAGANEFNTHAPRDEQSCSDECHVEC